MKIDLLENERLMLAEALSAWIYQLNDDTDVELHDDDLEDIKKIILEAQALKKKVQI